MNTWVRRTLQVGLISAGFVVAGAAAAHAADLTSVGNAGLLNGNQVYAPIQAPVNVCGNSIGVLGNASAACAGGATAVIDDGTDADDPTPQSPAGPGVPGTPGSNAGGTQLISQGNAGILNGNQIYAPIQAPINVCGNAIAALGNAQAVCSGGATALQRGGTAGGSQLVTAGNAGIGNGNQVYLPIQAPINISGNAVGVLGNAAAQSTGGSTALLRGRDRLAAPAGASAVNNGSASLTSVGNAGIANGNQTYAPVQVVTNVAGNAVGVLGNAQATSAGGATAVLRRGQINRRSAELTSVGNAGIANGNQTYAPVQAATNVCGNAVAALGNAQAACTGGATTTLNRSRRAAELTSVGNAGIANGNQTYAPVQVVTNVSGNAVGVLGNAVASSVGGATAAQ